jgi:hypothetical protein
MWNPCLKTGGELFLDAEGVVFECDLHTLSPDSNVVIAVTCQPIYRDPDPDRLMLTVYGTKYFRRDGGQGHFGVLVAKQSDCLASARLLAHIRKYYDAELRGFEFLTEES